MFSKPPPKEKKKPKPLKRTPLKRSTTPIKQKRSTPRKTERIINEQVLEKFRQLPCEACGAAPPSDPDHILHRGSGGDDVETNLISLCRQHHAERHSVGWVIFSKRYPKVKLYLLFIGRDDVLGRESKLLNTKGNENE